MNYPLDGHRCFKIPREKLDLFLVALKMNFSRSGVEHVAKHIFESKEEGFYAVVVARYGSSYLIEIELEEFVKAMKNDNSERLVNGEARKEFTPDANTFPILNQRGAMIFGLGLGSYIFADCAEHHLKEVYDEARALAKALKKAPCDHLSDFCFVCNALSRWRKFDQVPKEQEDDNV